MARSVYNTASEVVVADAATGADVRTGDAANAAQRVNVVAGAAGGGPATTADGADVTQGAIADAVVAAGAAGTLSAKLRRVTQGLEDLKTLIVLAAGSNNIGDVDIATVPADPFGANADAIVAAGAVGSIQAKLRRATQGLEDLKSLIVLATGTNVIGKVGIDQTTPGTTNLVDTELPAAALTADGAALPTAPFVRSVAHLYNGTTLDPQRGHAGSTVLSLAARTATNFSSNISLVNASGMYAFLYISAASGTGGLQLGVLVKDPASGFPCFVNVAPTAIVAAGVYAYCICRGTTAVKPTGWGAGSIVEQFTGAPLAKTVQIGVLHGDASSYTYSVGMSLIP